MTKIKSTFNIINLFAFILIGTSLPSFAQEHPKEHPKGKEHPKESAAISVETLAKAITTYISNDAALKGGYFLCFDKATKTPLVLSLVNVHKDKLSKVGDSVYFACSDFKTTDGKIYDLDFFMKSSKSGFDVSEIMVHKVEGKPRYGWYEENGKWIRK